MESVNMIGDRLKTIRKTAGFTQKGFADALKTTQRCISGYETGKMQIPDSLKETIYKMGYNLNWLITGKGEMQIKEPKDKIEKLKDLHKLFLDGVINQDDMESIKNEIVQYTDKVYTVPS